MCTGLVPGFQILLPCLAPTECQQCVWTQMAFLVPTGIYLVVCVAGSCVSSSFIRRQTVPGGCQETSVCLNAWMPVHGDLQIPGLQAAPRSPCYPGICFFLGRGKEVSLPLSKVPVSLVSSVFWPPIFLLFMMERQPHWLGHCKNRSLPTCKCSSTCIHLPSCHGRYLLPPALGWFLSCSLNPNPTVSIYPPSLLLLLTLQMLSLPIFHQLLNIFSIFHPITTVFGPTLLLATTLSQPHFTIVVCTYGLLAT